MSAPVRRRAICRFADGESAKAIAREIGVSASAVRKWAHAQGVRWGGVRKMTPPQVRAAAVERYRAGDPLADIASEVGVTEQRVMDWAHAAGVWRRWPSLAARKQAGRARPVELERQETG